jgi:hypothetical protein
MRPLVCLLLLFAASGARAQADVEFDALDLDGDGYVSLAEAAGNADVVLRFDRADRNRDGRLSFKEFGRLAKMKVRTFEAKREHVRSTLARDARAAEKEATAEAAPQAAVSAAAGGSARRASP